MGRIIRLTERDLTRIVRRVIMEQGPYAPGMEPKSSPEPTPYYPGVNPTIKPDFDTMKQMGTNSDASNNKVWKELKPEIERITGQKFKNKTWKIQSIFSEDDEWVENNLYFKNSQGVQIEIIYPASAVDAGVGNDGNFIYLGFWGIETPMKYGGSCFDISNIQTETGEFHGNDGYFGGSIKISCKKEILDLIKVGMSKSHDGITKAPHLMNR
jgi:hypothetical protein